MPKFDVFAQRDLNEATERLAGTTLFGVFRNLGEGFDCVARAAQRSSRVEDGL